MTCPTGLASLASLARETFGNHLLRAVETPTDETVDYRELTQVVLEDISVASMVFHSRTNSLERSVLKFKLPSCIRENLFFRFRKDLLPSLRDRVDSLCDGLEAQRSGAPDALPMFQNIHQELSGLKAILITIYSSIFSLYDLEEGGQLRQELKSGPMEESNLPEPLHVYPFERVASFVSSLAQCCEETFETMSESFLELSTLRDLDRLLEFDDDEECTVIELTRTISLNAELLIEILSEPEFCYFYQRCQVLATMIGENSIAHIYKLITSDPEVSKRRDSCGVSRLNSSRLHTFIPILKLARVFVNKVSKRVGSELHIVSRMTIEKQTQMLWAVGAIPVALKEFVECEAWLDPNDNPIWMRTFLLKTVSTFEGPLQTLNEHFNSCTIGTSTDDLLANRKAQDWCLMWAEQFDLAVTSFCSAFDEKF